MRVRILIASCGALCVTGGLFFVYRPLSAIFVGALLIVLAARGSKS